MNEELQKAIIEITRGLQKTAEGTGQFVIDQAPLLAQEFLCWEISKGIFTAIMLGGPALFILLKTRQVYLNYSNNKKSNTLSITDELLVESRVFTGLVIFICLAVAAYYNFYIGMKTLIAPRIVLIEKAAELIN